MIRHPASLSLDLDNEWSYLKTHGSPSWESLPSYLPTFVPLLLRFLEKRELRITVFVVGCDADEPGNRSVLAEIPAAGHEVGNHSYRHEPWLHRYERRELAEEIDRAETAIERATGVRPRGFRGPGFSQSAPLVEALAARGYRYDCSVLATFIGPIARAYYFRTSRLRGDAARQRDRLFGRWRDGLQPNRPWRWSVDSGSLLEIPVTTMPLFRVPIHLSYVLYLAQYSIPLARLYFRVALAMCRAAGTAPSLLLHPLDFLGGDEVDSLSFFPAMRRDGAWKRARAGELLDLFVRRFDPVPLGRVADALEADSALPSRAVAEA